MLSQTSKQLVDVKSTNNLLYLPLDPAQPLGGIECGQPAISSCRDLAATSSTTIDGSAAGYAFARS